MYALEKICSCEARVSVDAQPSYSGLSNTTPLYTRETADTTAPSRRRERDSVAVHGRVDEDDVELADALHASEQQGTFRRRWT